MSEECTHDCSTCGKNCGERKEEFSFAAPLNAASKVGKVIAVASGKGGVGKSFVTTMLAVAAMKQGLKVGILDADITGPSIPKAFGLGTGCIQGADGIEPMVTTSGIRVISLNTLVEDPTDPVVWRGPVIAGMVKQFWSDVHWGELDVMFVDMPPGTGDVPLTVFQSLPDYIKFAQMFLDGGRSADGIPVDPRRRHHHRHLAAGPRRAHRFEVRQDGRDDEEARRRSCREHELPQVP